MKALGIDIGTTSICVICYEKESGEIVESLSRPNLFLPRTFCQDPEKILEEIRKMLEKLETPKEQIQGIGISAQMHGILYVDEKGEAVSPYYTWKDESGKESFRQTLSYAGYLSRETGFSLFSGYGTVTHFVLQRQGKIPQGAVRMCNIGDYAAMRLTGSRTPRTEASVAASFGGFDPEKRDFGLERLSRAGVDTRYYPEIAGTKEVAGFWEGIPVFCAWGDNQASFYGAVGRDRETISVNVGTGSQVSLFDARFTETEAAETRPYLDLGYLYVGASLNGGKVYERLAAFWQEAFESLGIKVDVYQWMERVGRERENTSLELEPALYGARGKSREGGRMRNLTAENFHASDVIRAFVKGMAEELYGMYEAFPEELKKGRSKIAVSGNGIRKNRLLQQEVERVFGMPLVIRSIQEEAAAGAAMLALRYLEDGENGRRYQSEDNCWN